MDLVIIQLFGIIVQAFGLKVKCWTIKVYLLNHWFNKSVIQLQVHSDMISSST